MNVLVIKVGDKTHTTGRITSYLSRQALKIQADALKIGQLGQTLDATDVDQASVMFDELMQLKDRKSWLVCEIFGKAFTPEELEMEYTDYEIDAAVNMIISGVYGVISKNS